MPKSPSANEWDGRFRHDDHAAAFSSYRPLLGGRLGEVGVEVPVSRRTGVLGHRRAGTAPSVA